MGIDLAAVFILAAIFPFGEHLGETMGKPWFSCTWRALQCQVLPFSAPLPA